MRQMYIVETKGLQSQPIVPLYYTCRCYFLLQSVLPLVVATKMSGVKRSGLFTPFPDSYVRSVLKKVGTAERCFGYWPHELQVSVL